MRALAQLSALAAVFATTALAQQENVLTSTNSASLRTTDTLLALSDGAECAVPESFALTITMGKCFSPTEIAEVRNSINWPVSNAKFKSKTLKTVSCSTTNESPYATPSPLLRPPQIEIVMGKKKATVRGAVIIRVCPSLDCGVLPTDIVVASAAKAHSAISQSVRDLVDCPTPTSSTSCREHGKCQCKCPSGMSFVYGSCICEGGKEEVSPGVCACPGDQSFIDGTCQCPGDQYLVDGKCQCPGDQSIVDKKCQCPGDQSLVGDKCRCPGDQVFVDSKCRCAGDQLFVDGKCRCPGDQSFVDDKCQCPGDQSLVDNKCQCPGDQHFVNNKCQCAGDQSLVDNKCQCPGDQSLVDNKCQCAGDQLFVDGKCQCSGDQSFADGKCRCAGNQLFIDNKCQCAGDQSFIDGKCQCPGTQSLVNNKCQCPGDQSFVDGNCQCPGDQSLVDNKCQCPGDQSLADNKCQCAGDQFLVDNKCQCPGDQSLVDNKCQCPGDQSLVDDKCQCPGDQSLVGNKCQCPGDQSFVDGKCQCPGDQSLVGDKCQCPGDQVFVDGKCRCAGDQLFVDGKCRCPGDQSFVDDKCQCPGDQSLVDNKCQCPGDQSLADNKCQCAGDQSLVDNKCQCPGDHSFVDGKCQCPGDQSLVDGKCQCADGLSFIEGKCQCTGDRSLVDGKCQCAGNQLFVDGKCECPTGMSMVRGECSCPYGEHDEYGVCVPSCYWKANNVGLSRMWTDPEKASLKLKDDCKVDAPVPKDSYVNDGRKNQNDAAKIDPVIAITATREGDATGVTHNSPWIDYALTPQNLENEVTFSSFGVFDLALTATDYHYEATCRGCIAVVDKFPPTAKDQCKTSSDPGTKVLYSTSTLDDAIAEEAKFKAFYSPDNVVNNGAYDPVTGANERTEAANTEKKTATSDSCSFGHCLQMSSGTLVTSTADITTEANAKTTKIVAGLPTPITPGVKDIHRSITCSSFNAGCSYTSKLGELFKHSSHWGVSVPDSYNVDDFVYWRYSVGTESWNSWDDLATLTFTEAQTDVFVEAWTHCGQVFHDTFSVFLHPHSSRPKCVGFNAMWTELTAYPRTVDSHIESGLPHDANTVKGKLTDVKCYVKLAASGSLAGVTHGEVPLTLAPDQNGRIQVSKQLALELVHDPETVENTDVQVECAFTFTHYDASTTETDTCSHSFTITDCDHAEIETYGTEAVCKAGECLSPSGTPGPFEACGGSVFATENYVTKQKTLSGECCKECSSTLACTALTESNPEDGVERCEPATTGKSTMPYYPLPE
ncbi:uncharacterized protein PITG_08801 [Phytophthora infestans T30-4]|uniref:Uncharacterized protein n=1 Tax=Phytophthora infestans (strain T30-4) TaxID=403677 RepID=D0ND83_PHYIT|nr:uncharacterized protein PITG_08801 [Phytophthora infestans T30-4]EEY56040.1 conserved hypothetical protein [Phytophthora infestans T30-4]|eukprot:XP_002902870.1 conserved hypothetical protein [Phytophthora infestans T30-4]